MRRFLLIPSLSLGFAVGARADAPHDAAIAQYKSKDYPAARAAFEKLLAADSKDAVAQYYLGNLASKRGDTDEAIAHFESATTLDPKNSNYFMELGGAYGDAATKAGLLSKLSWAKKCQAALEHAVELDPDNVNARNGLITYYRSAPSFAGGSLDKAFVQAEEIKRRNPILGATVTAQLYISLKKFDEAYAMFDEVLAKSPDNYLALYSVGRTSAQYGLKLDEGEKALRHCLDLPAGSGDPPHAAVHWRLGNIAEKRHDSAKARAEYEAALKDDPNFTQAKESLSKLN